MVAPLVVGAGIAAGTALSGMIGSNTSAKNNMAMTNKQLAWEKQKFGMETELTNTAHQREVADLQAAGLNPVLSAGGQGATTPQAGSISALPDQSGQILSNSINSAFTNLIQEQMVGNQVQQMQHQNDLIDAEKLKAIAETGLADEKALETSANTALLKSQKDLIDEQWNKAVQDTNLAYAQVQQAYIELKYATQNAKNKAAILAAEKNYKLAEANMKEKENKLWTFSYIWDKGMDVGKVAGTIIGLGKLAKIIGPASGYGGLPGMINPNSAKSVFGFDKIRGQFY